MSGGTVLVCTVFELVVPWYIVTKLRLGFEVAEGLSVPRVCDMESTLRCHHAYVLQINHVMGERKIKLEINGTRNQVPGTRKRNVVSLPGLPVFSNDKV